MKNINSYDFTKKMLRTISEGNEIMQKNNSAIPITDDPKFGHNILTNEKNKLSGIIPLSITFTENPLTYNPQTKTLRFEGAVDLSNNSKLLFQYELNDGCYIANELVKMDENTFKAISRLYSNFSLWQEEWNKNLQDVIQNI